MINTSSLSRALILAAALCGQAAFAQEVPSVPPPGDADHSQLIKKAARDNPKYFTIDEDSVRVFLQEVTEEPDMSYVRLQEQPPKDVNEVLVTIDKIINIAQKLWAIVKESKPVSNINTKYATAYPQGVTSATQLSGWSRPKTYLYAFYAENMYGARMIDCTYKVSYTYNGAYKGKGKFLTGVTVIPTKVEVGWGYSFDMSAEVPDSTIANTGSDTDPVAALQMKLGWKMSTILKDVTGTSLYYIQGDGYFEEIASPWGKVNVKPADLTSSGSLLGPAPFN